MEEAAAGTALLRWGLPGEFLAAHHQQGHRANPSKLHEGTHDRRPCGWCKSSRGCVRQKGEHARMCVRFSFLGCRQVSVNKKLNFKPKKHKCTLGCVLSKSRRLQLECDRVYNTKTSIGCLACSTEPLTFNTNVSHEVLRENPSKNEHPRLATEHVTSRNVVSSLEVGGRCSATTSTAGLIVATLCQSRSAGQAAESTRVPLTSCDSQPLMQLERRVDIFA